METLRLMADYGCSPLWIAGPSGLKNISPGDLTLGNALSLEIAEWSEIYADTLDLKNPIDSGFESLESEQGFVKLGYGIAAQLTKRFKGIYEVRYFDCLFREYVEILVK